MERRSRLRTVRPSSATFGFTRRLAIGSMLCGLLVSGLGAADWLRTEALTRDWGGLRSHLEEKGVRVSLYYNHLHGFEGQAFGHSGSGDLLSQFDFEQMGLIRGGQALLHVKSNWGANINLRVGALGDPLDDADGDHPLYIDQLWYQHGVLGRRLELRIGYLDQQTILDRNEFANREDKQFMSTFLDNNNAIIPLAVGPGAAVFVNARSWLSFVVTASDASARPRRFGFGTVSKGEFLAYFETDLKSRLSSARGPLVGNYRVGFFLDPRDASVVDGLSAGLRNRGFYISADQMLWTADSRGERGLGAFLRYGHRPSEMNRIERFWSSGVEYAGALPSRPRDVLGFARYTAIGSRVYRNRVEPDFDRETAYEAYYSLQVAPAITLTPAFQYIRQPGGLKSRERTFVAAIRLRLTL